MNVQDLMSAIARCADNARKEYPDSVDQRARCFVARLTGSLESSGEFDLAKNVFSILDRPDEGSPA